MISVFELFTVGIGPSSSHTVGPMRAARQFARDLAEERSSDHVDRILVELLGSLGLTGRSHGTEKAVVLGLMGYEPDEIDPDHIPELMDEVRRTSSLVLAGGRSIGFQLDEDIVFHTKRRLSQHPNAMTFEAWEGDTQVFAQTWFSVGGGFIATEETMRDGYRAGESPASAPYPFASAAEMLEQAARAGLSIPELVLANETVNRSEAAVRQGVLEIWAAMKSCVERGLQSEGTLPGGLGVQRRAAALHRKLLADQGSDPMKHVDWLNIWALAVNEENAAGGRVVTAPTNGAAGIVPSVLHYYDRLVPDATEDGVVDFLLTATAIGALFKQMASISGADVGCQGEVGSASSMAAGGLVAALGGTPEQVEHAAEIAMEHNLGLTCDPVGGLVQIPCIERNAMAAAAAVNASRMALQGEGEHLVSLDQVITTMRETGADMHDKYKETAQGGLAVNVVAC